MKTRISKALCLMLAVTFILLSLISCGGQKPSTSEAQGADSDPTSAGENDATTAADDGTTATDGTAENTSAQQGTQTATGDQPDSTASQNTTAKNTTAKKTTKKNTTATKDDFKGTTYYVSSSTGDDWGDGDSEDTAIKSLAVASTLASSGDRILLKRGDIWRGEVLTTASGITYGAYGTGNAPKIYGSSQNYSAKGKWKATSDSRIFYFDGTVAADVGGIVFDNGSAYGVRQTTQSALKADRQFYYDNSARRVYLYSRKGNPADVWSSIEFNERINLISLKGDNVTIQDLELRYADYGIVGGNNKNVTIKNCSFSWLGGCLHSYSNTTRYGNAVELYGGVNGLTVDNCKFDQIFDTAVTVQYIGNTDTTIQNVTVSNNKISNCQWSMEFWLECKDGSGKYIGTIKNVKIINNECKNAGKGWSATQRMGSASVGSACHFMTMTATGYSVSDVLLKNNTFSVSAGEMMGINWKREAVTFEGNTYIQTKGGSFGRVGSAAIPYDDSVAAKIKELDPTGTVKFAG